MWLFICRHLEKNLNTFDFIHSDKEKKNSTDERVKCTAGLEIWHLQLAAAHFYDLGHVGWDGELSDKVIHLGMM